nr:tripartite tricarboxylate transporter TctB family [uncultured bacterium]
MRAGLIVVGIIIAALGIWVALGKFTYNDNETKAQLGPIKVQASEQKVVPQALGYIGIVVGAGLIIAGAMRKS